MVEFVYKTDCVTDRINYWVHNVRSFVRSFVRCIAFDLIRFVFFNIMLSISIKMKRRICVVLVENGSSTNQPGGHIQQFNFSFIPFHVFLLLFRFFYIFKEKVPFGVMNPAKAKKKSIYTAINGEKRRKIALNILLVFFCRLVEWRIVKAKKMASNPLKMGENAQKICLNIQNHMLNIRKNSFLSGFRFRFRFSKNFKCFDSIFLFFFFFFSQYIQYDIVFYRTGYIDSIMY